MVRNGFKEINLKGRRLPSGNDSGRTKKPKMQFAKTKNADKKNGARELISPKIPPNIGPKINPIPKAAPIRPKFFAFSAGVEISAK